MKWADSLIRIAKFEVETLQKRLADIAARRTDAEMKLTMLEAEGEAEAQRAQRDASIGWYMIGFQQGLKSRKAAVNADLAALEVEEAGARDALAHAFEELKKYEQVADQAKTAKLKAGERIETAQMDEMGLRRAANF
jgi:flagellar protein FliJ